MRFLCFLYIAPADFTAINQDITFQPSDMDARRSISVQIRDDPVVENPERFVLVISSDHGRGVNISEAFTTDVIITDNDGGFIWTPRQHRC